MEDYLREYQMLSMQKTTEVTSFTQGFQYLDNYYEISPKVIKGYGRPPLRVSETTTKDPTTIVVHIRISQRYPLGVHFFMNNAH